MPVLRCMALSSARICLRSLGSRAARGSSRRSRLGFEDERAGEGDALFLAAGELGGKAVAFGGELDEFESAQGAGFGVLGAALAESEFDVAEGGEMGEEGVVLEDGADVALVGFEVVDGGAVEHDFAGGGLFEAADHAEGGGFAAAGGAEEGVETAAFESEGNVVYGAVAGVIFAEAAKLQDWVRHSVIRSCHVNR